MKRLDKQELIQEGQYNFPYHYLIDFNAQGFSQYRHYPGGIFYIGYLLRTLMELELLEFESVVDVGCGDGYFCQKLVEWFPNRRIVGIDYSEQAISMACLMNRGKPIEFIFRDISKCVLDDKFDIATSVAVLEHIPPRSVRHFVRGMHNLLKRQGTLVICVPSVVLPVENIPKHYQHFTEKSLSEELSPFFEITKLTHIVRRYDPLTRLINRLLSNRFFILNHNRIKNWLFHLYIEKRLSADSLSGTMILAVCRSRVRPDG